MIPETTELPNWAGKRSNPNAFEVTVLLVIDACKLTISLGWERRIEVRGPAQGNNHDSQPTNTIATTMIRLIVKSDQECVVGKI